MKEARSVIPLVLNGIDVGATKTRLARGVCLAPTGSRTPVGSLAEVTVLEEHVVATPSWRTGPPEQNAAALALLVVDAFGVDALEAPLAVGAHGCDSTELCRALARTLGEHFLGPVRVVNDAELMPWAMGRVGGIGLVVGTGSIAVSRDENDELLTAGGWGWILGDEGGASGLVREATRAVLARLDDGNGLDRLGRRLFAAFGVSEGPQLAMALSDDPEAHLWGLHAPEVFRAAAEGSTDARRVIHTAADRLAEMVAQLRGRGVASREVVAGGSVIVGQPLMRSAVASALARRCPDVRLSILDAAPVLGAVRLAGSLSRDPRRPSHPLAPTALTTLDATEAPA